MSRIWCLLALVTACATPPMPVPPTNTQSSCPELVCSTCPEPVCSETVCPTCPSSLPAPLEPEASDWQCMDLRFRRGRKTTSFCWITENICQLKRKAAHKKRLGKAGPCTPQRVAYCFQSIHGGSMSRRLSCTRTADECHAVHKDLIPKQDSYDHLTECQPLLNTDRFDAPVGFEPRNIDP